MVSQEKWLSDKNIHGCAATSSLEETISAFSTSVFEIEGSYGLNI